MSNEEHGMLYIYNKNGILILDRENLSISNFDKDIKDINFTDFMSHCVEEILNNNITLFIDDQDIKVVKNRWGSLLDNNVIKEYMPLLR